LFKLGHINFNEEYLNRAAQMLRNVQPHMAGYGPGFSNWAQLLLFELSPFYEIVITGTNSPQLGQEFRQTYLPNRILMGATKSSNLPMFESRFFEGETTIFVCVNKACQMPVNSVSAALTQIK
jgi:uncharacterized protein YyaL (SSP411 family)